MFKSILLITACFCYYLSYSQNTNTDANQGYINVNTPRSPESAGFEKYGSTEVNEFSGTTNIAIPIYTVKSRYLEVPITLSYQATGIKVNQEASWVGLGWDLNAGGRITVEVRGSADFNSQTALLVSSSELATGMQRIFNRVGIHGENEILTPSTLCESGEDDCLTDTNFDYLPAIQGMTEFGTGEPDIFRANFLGHSLTFYIDKITHNIKFLGEKSFFKIFYNTDVYNNIINWTLTDNNGITYYFNQAETSFNTLPANAAVPFTVTTGWALTKIVHPSGDYIQFTYENDGYTVPAFSMSGWVNYKATDNSVTFSQDQMQNVTLQSPNYLIKIESSDAIVDFTLAARTDLYGPGSRKLINIKVSDKLTGEVKQTATFHYSYFQSAYRPWSTYLNSLSYYLPSPLSQSDYLACSNSRLRLDSVSVNLETFQPPYKFTYNSTVPDKYSYSQDYWGYLNAAVNQTNGYSFTHLIPLSGVCGVGNDGSLPSVINKNIFGSSRDCDPSLVQAMILTGIEYPTGGSTAFTYEPHQSTMALTKQITGGGVRIKTIKNYALGKLVNTINYTYSGGKYMGNIQYYTSANELSKCSLSNSFVIGQKKYSTNGAVNDDNILIGYEQITKKEQGPNEQSNGSEVKTFNIVTSSSLYQNGLKGFELHPPYFPPLEPPPIYSYQTYDFWLDPSGKNFPPTPTATLEGKLLQDKYYDNFGNPVKEINYYYDTSEYTNFFYDIKAIQNREGGFDYGGCNGGSINSGLGNGGNRPVYLFISPAKSFFIHTDSIVTKIYSGVNTIIEKKTLKYNRLHQIEYETNYCSDGSQLITHYVTTGSAIPGNFPPNGTLENSLYSIANNIHNINLPIETTTLKRNQNGDTNVIKSIYIQYMYGEPFPAKIFQTEFNAPVGFRSGFSPISYTMQGSSFTLSTDNHYTLQETAIYDSLNEYPITQIITPKETLAFLWDDNKKAPIAKVLNAGYINSQQQSLATFGGEFTNSINYSFQTGVNGTIAFSFYPSGGLTTGTKYHFSLVGQVNITDSFCLGTGCSNYASYTYNNMPAGSYILKINASEAPNGDYKTVVCNGNYQTMKTIYCPEFFYEGFEVIGNATSNPCAGKGYYKGDFPVPFIIPNGKNYQVDFHYLSNGKWYSKSRPYINNMILNDGSAIDEVRVYPIDAQMTSYTYDGLVGMTSQCDINNNITSYDYDGLGRLIHIRDLDNNIIKKFGYNYAGNKFVANKFTNLTQTKTFAKNDCIETDYAGSEVTDTVYAGTFESDSSQEEADSLALAYLQANGQSFANTNGTCLPKLQIILNNYELVAGFTITLTSVYDSSKVFTIAFPSDSDSAISVEKIPQGRYNITVSKTGNTSSYLFTVSGPSGDIEVNAAEGSWENVPVNSNTFNRISIGIKQE